jgi:hypothetical protein
MTKACQSFLWSVLLLWLCCTGIHALNLLSQYDSVVSINGTLYSQSKLTAQCTPSDMDQDHTLSVQDDAGVSHSVVIHCTSQVHVYGIQQEGFIPADGGEFTSTVCLEHSLDGSNAPSTPTTSVSPASRVLLEDPAYSNFARSSKDNDTLIRLCNQFASSARSPNFLSNCLNGPNLDVYNNLVKAKNASQTDLAAFIDAFANFQGNVTKLDEDLTVLNTQFTNYSSVLTLQLNEIQLQQKLVRDKIADTMKVVNTNNQKQLDALAALDSSISNSAEQIALLVNASSSNFNKLAAAMAAQYQQQTRSFLALSQEAIDTKSNIYEQFRATQVSILDLFSAQRQFFLGTQMLNEQNRQIQSNLTKLQSTPNVRGVMLKVFLTDVGSRNATSLNVVDRKVTFASDALRYIVSSGALTLGILTTFQYQCDTQWLVDTQAFGPTWRDFYDWIGPDQCDTTWVTQSPRCKCVMVVKESQCTLSSSGGLSASAITQWQSNPTDVSTVSGCIPSSSAPGPLDGASGTNVSSTLSLFQTVSRRGLYTGTRYQFTFNAAGATANVSYSSRVDNITSIGVTTFMNPTDADGIDNIVFFYFQTLQLSYTSTMAHLDYYTGLIYGTLPSGMTQTSQAFARLSTGDTGRCWNFTTVLYSEQFLTVSSLLPGDTTSSITVTTDGVATQVQSSIVSNPYEFLRPSTDAFVWSQSLFTTDLWNTPRRSVSISPYAPNRGHKVTYPMVKNIAKFSKGEWEALWDAGDFDHLMAFNFASAYRVSLDSNAASSTYGRCVTSNPAAAGRWCVIRDHYRMAVAGNEMFLSPRETTYVFTISIPGKQITQTLGSNCPIVDSVANLNGHRVVQITNPQETTNQIQISQVGACPSTHVLQLGNRQTYNFDVFSCPGADISTPDTLQFSFFSGGGYVRCNTTVVLAPFNSTSYTFTGIASLGVLTAVQVATSDQSLAYLAQTRAQLLELAYRVTTMLQKVQQDTAFVVSNATVDNFGLVYSLISQNVDKTRSLVQNISLIARDFATPDSTIDAEFTASIMRAKDLAAQAIADLKAIATQSDLVEGDMSRLGPLAQVAIETLQRAVISLSAFFPAILAAESAISNGCNLTRLNDTCWKDIAALVVAIGNLDPDTAACAPSALAKLFGSSTIDAWAQSFGGCSRGNLIVGFLLAALIMFGSGFLVFVLIRYIIPAIRRRADGGRLRSTVRSDDPSKVALDEEITKAEKQMELFATTNGTYTRVL